MNQMDFYNDLKWCNECGDYVRYLMSMDHSFCVCCGEQVRLFNEQDWETVNEAMQAKKSKGGRPRKDAATKAA